MRPSLSRLLLGDPADTGKSISVHRQHQHPMSAGQKQAHPHDVDSLQTKALTHSDVRARQAQSRPERAISNDSRK